MHGALGSQLKFQEVVSCPTWVLRTKLQSSGGTASAVNHWLKLCYCHYGFEKTKTPTTTVLKHSICRKHSERMEVINYQRTNDLHSLWAYLWVVWRTSCPSLIFLLCCSHGRHTMWTQGPLGAGLRAPAGCVDQFQQCKRLSAHVPSEGGRNKALQSMAVLCPETGITEEGACGHGSPCPGPMLLFSGPLWFSVSGEEVEVQRSPHEESKKSDGNDSRCQV